MKGSQAIGGITSLMFLFTMMAGVSVGGGGAPPPPPPPPPSGGGGSGAGASSGGGGGGGGGKGKKGKGTMQPPPSVLPKFSRRNPHHVGAVLKAAMAHWARMPFFAARGQVDKAKREIAEAAAREGGFEPPENVATIWKVLQELYKQGKAGGVCKLLSGTGQIKVTGGRLDELLTVLADFVEKWDAALERKHKAKLLKEVAKKRKDLKGRDVERAAMGMPAKRPRTPSPPPMGSYGYGGGGAGAGPQPSRFGGGGGGGGGGAAAPRGRSKGKGKGKGRNFFDSLSPMRPTSSSSSSSSAAAAGGQVEADAAMATRLARQQEEDRARERAQSQRRSGSGARRTDARTNLDIALAQNLVDSGKAARAKIEAEEKVELAKVEADDRRHQRQLELEERREQRAEAREERRRKEEADREERRQAREDARMTQIMEMLKVATSKNGKKE